MTGNRPGFLPRFAPANRAGNSARAILPLAGVSLLRALGLGGAWSFPQLGAFFRFFLSFFPFLGAKKPE